MNILVTGGRGFIGTHACDALLKRGHELVVVDLRPLPDGTTSQHHRVRHIQADIRDRQAMNEAMQGCDAVLHLAAAHHDYGLTEATFESVNVEGTRAILDAARASGVGSLCFYSSVAVYGSAAGHADESTMPAPESPYGRTKLQAEDLVRQWAADQSGRCVIIRPAVVFGEGHFANMFTLIRQIDRGVFLQIGNGKNYKSVCYVKNIVAATLSVWLENPPDTGEVALYNYADSPDLTSAQIAEHIRCALRRRRSTVAIPYALARFLVLPIDAFAHLTDRHFPVSGARIKKFAVSGFTPDFSITDGLDRMIAWYQAEKKEGTSFRDVALLPPEHFSA